MKEKDNVISKGNFFKNKKTFLVILILGILIILIFALKNNNDLKSYEDSVYLNKEKEIYNNLNDELENLKTEITTYKLYVENRDKVKSFYDDVIEETDNFNLEMRECALAEAKEIIEKDETSQERFNDIEENIYENIYNVLVEDTKDDICFTLFEDAVDVFNFGVLNDLPDDVNYSEYREICDIEYDNYRNAYDKTFESCDLAIDDVFTFENYLTKYMYFNEDFKMAQKIIDKFEDRINKLKLGEEVDNINDWEENIKESTEGIIEDTSITSTNKINDFVLEK